MTDVLGKSQKRKKSINQQKKNIETVKDHKALALMKRASAKCTPLLTFMRSFEATL